MEDIQNLLEKINRDGIEKAEAESRKIIAAAEQHAELLLKNAREEAAKLKADGEKDAANYAERAKVTIGQAARDTVLKVESAITQMLEKLLVQNIDQALNDESAVQALVTEATKDMVGGGEIACGEKLAKALATQIASRGNFTVVTDNFSGTGFTVKTDNGRVEHSFKGEVIAEELAKRLRPDLAALLK